MNGRPRVILAATIFAINVVAGCALTKLPVALNPSEVPVWRGRLAVWVEGAQSQSASGANTFSGAFELSGTPAVGELTIYTPVGTTAASLSWTVDSACLSLGGEPIHCFESLDALVKQTMGTELPVAALFAWLAGDNLTLAGWRADLSQRAKGRITARRTNPVPLAELRLVLEEPFDGAPNIAH